MGSINAPKRTLTLSMILVKILKHVSGMEEILSLIDWYAIDSKGGT